MKLGSSPPSPQTGGCFCACARRKRVLLAELPHVNATRTGAAGRYGFGPGDLDEYPARIGAVTREQANAALMKYFIADKLSLVIAGDLDKLPE